MRLLTTEQIEELIVNLKLNKTQINKIQKYKIEEDYKNYVYFVYIIESKHYTDTDFGLITRDVYEKILKQDKDKILFSREISTNCHTEVYLEDLKFSIDRELIERNMLMNNYKDCFDDLE